MLFRSTRGLGLADGYPFVLSDRVVGKLRFVYETIKQSLSASDEMSAGRAVA